LLRRCASPARHLVDGLPADTPIALVGHLRCCEPVSVRRPSLALLVTAAVATVLPVWLLRDSIGLTVVNAATFARSAVAISAVLRPDQTGAIAMAPCSIRVSSTSSDRVLFLMVALLVQWLAAIPRIDFMFLD
jgi:hypothetical protein